MLLAIKSSKYEKKWGTLTIKVFGGLLARFVIYLKVKRIPCGKAMVGKTQSVMLDLGILEMLEKLRFKNILSI